MRKVLSTLIAVAAMTPAFAADRFYIVRDPVARRCTVVNQRPTLTTTQIVGDVYRTRTEAETAMRATSACAQD